jgi:hypothetical protein
MMRFRIAVALTTALIAGLTLAACSGSGVTWDNRSVDPDGGGSAGHYEEWTPGGFRNPR